MSDPPSGAEFLKRRYARAIESGDHRTATRLRAEIDRLINGQAFHGPGTSGGGVAEADWWQSIEQGQTEPAVDSGDVLAPHL